MTRNRNPIFAFLTATAILAALALGGNAFAFKVTRNRPFAAKVNGPMGALIVRDSGAYHTPRRAAGASAAAVSTALASAPTTQAVQKQHGRAMLTRAARGIQLLENRGVPHHHNPLHASFPRIMVHTTPSDQIVLPDLVAHAAAVSTAAADPSPFGKG